MNHAAGEKALSPIIGQGWSIPDPVQTQKFTIYPVAGTLGKPRQAARRAIATKAFLLTDLRPFLQHPTSLQLLHPVAKPERHAARPTREAAESLPPAWWKGEP